MKSSNRPQKSLDSPSFEIEYFIQTRKEIDTEKQERNKILNYAIIATGVSSVFLLRIEGTFEFLKSPNGLFVYIPLLILISALVAARRMKLRQIADRWFTLYNLLSNRKKAKQWTSLERVVCEGLVGRRYLSEDFILHFALSMVIYCLIGVVVFESCELGQCFWQSYWPAPIIGTGAVVLHFVFSSIWLWRPIPISSHYEECVEELKQ